MDSLTVNNSQGDHGADVSIVVTPKVQGTWSVEKAIQQPKAEPDASCTQITHKD